MSLANGNHGFGRDTTKTGGYTCYVLHATCYALRATCCDSNPLKLMFVKSKRVTKLWEETCEANWTCYSFVVRAMYNVLCRTCCVLRDTLYELCPTGYVIRDTSSALCYVLRLDCTMCYYVLCATMAVVQKQTRRK